MADVQTIKDRIKLALDKSKKSQRDLARELGLASATVSGLLNREGDPPLKYVEAVSRITNVPVDFLLNGVARNAFNDDEGNLIVNVVNEDSANSYLSGKNIRLVTVTVDQSGRELITYVPVKAQAGYAKGYGDDKFIKKLPAFSLPNFNDKGSFRMFQVDGDSMLQLGGGGLKDGDIVIAQYVEDIFSVRDNMVYVVVDESGCRIKRVINRLMAIKQEDRCLVLKSDNKNGQHENKIVHPHQIIEVWEYKAHISRNVSFATDLWDLINDLQVQQTKLNARMDKIDGGSQSLLNQ